MLSLLIVLLVISSLSLITLNNYQVIDLSHYDFINEYLDKQSSSLVNKKRLNINEYNISFNENGHINRAGSIDINNFHLIMHIGNGYLTYEK